jgi:hypothetical protein
MKNIIKQISVITGLFLGSIFIAYAITAGSIPYGSGGTDYSLLASSTGGVLSNSYSTGNPTWIATSTLNIPDNGITALTSDVTASGNGSQAATIAANAVTYAKFQTVAANSLVGNPTGVTATAQAIATSTLFTGTAGWVNYFSASNSLTGTSTVFILPSTNVGIGTTTSLVKLSVVKAVPATGAIATTTLQIGDVSTTTSKSSIQLNNTAGTPTCIYVNGTTLIVKAETCK